MKALGQRSSKIAVGIGSLSVVVSLLPVFLTGALAVELREDLVFSSAALGMAVAGSRAVGAVASPLLGRVADHLGASRSLRLAALVSAASALGIAVTADRWVVLLAWLVFGGAAGSLSHPAANRLIATVVDPRRQGAAFGLKQSAPPVASMLAGLSVPAIALTVGWRWAFVLAALLAIAMAVSVGSAPPREGRPRFRAAAKGRLERRGLIVLLSAGFGFGTSTSVSVATFYVESTVDAGFSGSFAGILLAAGSITAIGVRVGSGIACDRMRTGHLKLCALLLVLGTVGVTMLTQPSGMLRAAGVVIGLGGAWGFHGILFYAMVRRYPSAPGRITGALAPGGLLGGTLGPLAFGVLADAFGYTTAWATFSVLPLLGATAMYVGEKRLPDLVETT